MSVTCEVLGVKYKLVESGNPMSCDGCAGNDLQPMRESLCFQLGDCDEVSANSIWEAVE